MVAAVIPFQFASAHTPPWQVPTFANINVAPDPVGVGQKGIVIFWLDKTFDGTALINDYRFHNYQLNITKPDGTMQTINFQPTDPTSSQFTSYTPDQVGTYIFNFTFPGQAYNTYSHNPQFSICQRHLLTQHCLNNTNCSAGSTT